MKKRLTKDYELTSGRIIKKGTYITDEKNSENILMVEKETFRWLEKENFFKNYKQIKIN